MAIGEKLVSNTTGGAGLWFRLWSDKEGATAVEYGLLAGLIAVGLAGGIGALADLVLLLFDLIVERTGDVGGTVSADDTD